MPFPYDMGRVLVGAPENTRLRVRGIAYQPLRDSCHDIGIHVGDELTCVASTSSHLVLELSAHRRVLLERLFSNYIEVEPIALTRAVA